jgi:hypothetical protein
MVGYMQLNMFHDLTEHSFLNKRDQNLLGCLPDPVLVSAEINTVYSFIFSQFLWNKDIYVYTATEIIAAWYRYKELVVTSKQVAF